MFKENQQILSQVRLWEKMIFFCMHVSRFLTSLSRTAFPVTAVVNVAELSFSLDLEVMSFSNSTSSKLPPVAPQFYCARTTLSFEGFISKSSELWESTWAYAGMVWIQPILPSRPLHQGRYAKGFACVAGSILSSFEYRWGGRLGKHEWRSICAISFFNCIFFLNSEVL